MNHVSPSTILLYLVLSSILLSISIIMPKNSLSVVQDPTFISRKWNITLKHVFGMTFSASLSRTSACLLAPFVQRF